MHTLEDAIEDILALVDDIEKVDDSEHMNIFGQIWVIAHNALNFESK